MRQSRLASAVEASTSTAVGFVVSVFVLAGVNWLWNLHLSVTDNLLITCIFTAASILRSYLVRRLFNWWHHKNEPIQSMH